MLGSSPCRSTMYVHISRQRACTASWLRRRVYVLTNYGTTMEENLYRIYHLRELGFDPYVMIYDKPNAPKEIKQLQRWVNNKFIWRSCDKFEDYQGGVRPL